MRNLGSYLPNIARMPWLSTAGRLPDGQKESQVWTPSLVSRRLRGISPHIQTLPKIRSSYWWRRKAAGRGTLSGSRRQFPFKETIH